ncbi:NAD(P)H-binding protein [Paenibacillus sp. IB182496]|uniref:NAD(P)H-binding protein n=1 Tax=Paenibacillus sabuli TaxID=2772509 RepID=A0A927BXB7_9BACL|nr:NAD(P)H-binding protein [Paenibacillus sabuli]MBD2848606.1 NAD(P)H-binding protein [Paenibacillus sabuli]
MVHAIIAGATGLVGRELVHTLCRDERFGPVTALVRRPVLPRHAQLEQRVVDFDRLDALPAEWFRNAAIFCALGTTIKKAGSKENFRRVDFEYPLALGRLAQRGGAAGFFVVSAMGADPRSKFFYSRVKGELEEALAKLDLLRLEVFRPSLLLGQREERRFGEHMATVAARWIPDALMGKAKPIAGSAVAQAMAHAALGTGNGLSLIPSPQIAMLAGQYDKS